MYPTYILIKLLLLVCSQRILEHNEDLPATKVQPTDGLLYWVLDKEAGSLLDSTLQSKTDNVTVATAVPEKI